MGEDRLVMTVEGECRASARSAGNCRVHGRARRRAMRRFPRRPNCAAQGIRVELAEGKLKKVFEIANKLNARLAIIFGETEVSAGTVSMKDLESHEQRTFPRRDLVEQVKKCLKPVALDFLGELRRTHTCGELRASDAGQPRHADGLGASPPRSWRSAVRSSARPRRRHAGRLSAPTATRRCTPRPSSSRSEYVIAVEGPVTLRTKETINPTLETGEVEVVAEKLWILNESRTPPFPMEETVDVKEDARLKYRYVDLRRPHMQRNIILRSKIAFAVREVLTGMGFLEIETPFMTRSTPEGARDYLVPSRVNPGRSTRCRNRRRFSSSS